VRQVARRASRMADNATTVTLTSVMPHRQVGTHLRHILADGDRSLAETDDALQQFASACGDCSHVASRDARLHRVVWSAGSSTGIAASGMSPTRLGTSSRETGGTDQVEENMQPALSCRTCGESMSDATCRRCTLERPIGEETAHPRLVRPYIRDTRTVNSAQPPAVGDAPRDQRPLTTEPAGVDADTDRSPSGRYHGSPTHGTPAAREADWRFGQLIGAAVLAGALASAVTVTALNLTSRPRSDTFTSLPAPMSISTASASPTPVASPTLSPSATSPSPTRSADPAPRSTTATPTRSIAPAVPSGPTLLPITPRTAHIIGYAGLCVDDDSNWNTLGNKIKIWECNGTEAQTWLFGSDGTVRVHDMCVRASGSAPGALVQLWTCDGTQLQKWQFDSDGELVNRAAGLCMTVPDATRTPGTQLQTSSCRDAEGQHWTLG
jgi:hypothetical protein